MLRPTFHPSGISGLGTQHPLHSPHGQSFLVLSESWRGRKQTVNSSHQRQIFLSDVLSKRCTALDCLLQQEAQPKESNHKCPQNEQLCMNYRYIHLGKGQNNTIPGAVLRNAFSLLYSIPVTPSFCETVIPLFLSCLVINPLHLEGQRIMDQPYHLDSSI